MAISTAILLLISALIQFNYCRVLYVDQKHPSIEENGSWEQPFKTIKSCVLKLQNPGNYLLLQHWKIKPGIEGKLSWNCIPFFCLFFHHLHFIRGLLRFVKFRNSRHYGENSKIYWVIKIEGRNKKAFFEIIIMRINHRYLI